jgi:hypothetical protein
MHGVASHTVMALLRGERKAPPAARCRGPGEMKWRVWCARERRPTPAARALLGPRSMPKRAPLETRTRALSNATVLAGFGNLRARQKPAPTCCSPRADRSPRPPPHAPPSPGKKKRKKNKTTTVVASLALASFFASLHHGASIALGILRALLAAALCLLILPWRGLCLLAAGAAAAAAGSGSGDAAGRRNALAFLGGSGADGLGSSDRHAAPLPPDVRRELQRLLDAALEQPHTLLSPTSRNARALRRVSARVQQLQREHDERLWRERRAERQRQHERRLQEWERERARRARRHEQEVERWESRRRRLLEQQQEGEQEEERPQPQQQQQRRQPLPPRPAPPPVPSPPASPPSSPPPERAADDGAPYHHLLRLPWQLVLLHQRLEAAVTAMAPDQLHALLGGGNPQPAGLTDAEVRRLPRLPRGGGGGSGGGAGASGGGGGGGGDEEGDDGARCCPICLCALRNGADKLTVLPACGHTLHLGCARKWLARRGECPVCRAGVIVPPLPPTTPTTTPSSSGQEQQQQLLLLREQGKAAAAEAAMSARRARAHV